MARVDPAGPATPVGRADPATPVGRADPAGRVTVVDTGDMNRVAAATVGTAAAMAPADLASRAVPVDPVGMTLVDPVGMTPGDPVGPAGMTLANPEVPVGMIPADPVGPAGMILGDPEDRLRAPNPVVRVDPERLVVRNPVVQADPGSREATDLTMGRAPRGRMPVRPVRTPTRLHLTAARRLPMPARLRLAPADRRTAVDPRWDPTTRAVAPCREATRAAAIRRAEATLAAAIRRAAATLAAEATPSAERNRICPSHLAKAGAVSRQRYLTPSTA